MQLVPAHPAFLIKTAAPHADGRLLYKDHIVSGGFLSQINELSTEMVYSHKEMLLNLNKQNLIPHITLLIETLNIASGGSSYEFDNVFKGNRPELISLAMVADAAATGSYPRNAFNFQKLGLNYITLSANSQMIRRIILQPNLATQDYLREFLLVMEAMGYDTSLYLGNNAHPVSKRLQHLGVPTDAFSDRCTPLETAQW